MEGPMSAGLCLYCKKPVDANKDYRKVEGWEKSRSGGGTNAIRLREPKDEWECTSCIDSHGRGISLEQGSLLSGLSLISALVATRGRAVKRPPPPTSSRRWRR